MSDGRITVGNVEVLCLSDATVDYPWPLEQIFPGVADAAWEPYRRRYPSAFSGPNVYRSDYAGYLVRSPGRTVLVDTAMGPAGAPLAGLFQREGQLLTKLREAGVTPEQVDTVVLTHLHPDHVGWNVQRENGAYRATFPRARYLVHRLDWEAFLRPEVQAHLPFPYVDQTVTPLATLGAVDLIADHHAISAQLTTLHTPGHTPGHMSILVASGGERALILGDVAIHPAQVTEPDWNSMFEMDGATAVQTRGQILDRIEAEGMTVVACHFPEPGMGKVVRLDGRRYWQGL